jgi:hypothetical protein
MPGEVEQFVHRPMVVYALAVLRCEDLAVRTSEELCWQPMLLALA